MEKPDRTNWILVFAILVAGLFAAGQFGKLTLTLAELRLIYPGWGLAVPVLVSIVGVVGIAFGAVAGTSVARAGVSRVLLAGLVTGGALSLIEALLPPLPVFALQRVLEGLSHLAIVVAAPAILAAIASEADRPVVMGIWAAFFGIAMAILAAILPAVLGAGGLPLLFVGHGLGMWIIALILAPMLPHLSRADAPPLSFWAEHRAIYSAPRLILPGAGFVWYTIIYIALLAVIPILRGLDVFATTMLPLVSIAGTLFGGWVAKRVPPIALVQGGFAATALCGLLLILIPQTLWPVLLMFLVMAFIPAGCFAAIPYFNASTPDRARSTGGLAQLGNVGTTLGTPIFVLATEYGGEGAMVLVLLLFCAGGLVVTALLRVRVK